MEKNLKKISVALFEAELNFRNGIAALNEVERQFKSGFQNFDEARRIYRELSSLLGYSDNTKEGRSPNPGSIGLIKLKKTIRYELDGLAAPINRLALKATQKLAEKLTYGEMVKRIPQEAIMPHRGKLTMWVEVDKVHEHTSEPKKRYFVDHPITTRDGKKIFCTTQWATKEYDKGSGNYVDGTFIRFIKALAAEGVYITEIS